MQDSIFLIQSVGYILKGRYTKGRQRRRHITTTSSHCQIKSRANLHIDFQLQYIPDSGKLAFFLLRTSVSRYQKREFSGTEIAHTRGAAATIIAKAVVGSPNLTQIAEPQPDSSSEKRFLVSFSSYILPPTEAALHPFQTPPEDTASRHRHPGPDTTKAQHPLTTHRQPSDPANQPPGHPSTSEPIPSPQPPPHSAPVLTPSSPCRAQPPSRSRHSSWWRSSG